MQPYKFYVFYSFNLWEKFVENNKKLVSSIKEILILKF